MKTIQTTDYEYDDEGRVLRQTVTREDASDNEQTRSSVDYTRARYGDPALGTIRQEATTSKDGSHIVSTKTEAWTPRGWVDVRDLVGLLERPAEGPGTSGR